MRILYYILLITFCSIVTLTSIASANLIDMEGIAPSGGGVEVPPGTTHTFDGYNLTLNGSGWYVDELWVPSGGRIRNSSGTDHLYAYNANGFTIASADTGGTFTLKSFEAGDILAGENADIGNFNIQVVGTLSGGGIMQTSFLMPSLSPFTTYTLPGTWVNLTSVQFYVENINDPDGFVEEAPGLPLRPNNSRGGFDNIVVENTPIIKLNCDIQMSQQIYTTGDTVTASVFSVENQGINPINVEWKVWLVTPFTTPISILNIGFAELTPGFLINIGPLNFFPAANVPAGTYELNSRLLDPVTGDLLCEDINVFEIQ